MALVAELRKEIGILESKNSQIEPMRVQLVELQTQNQELKNENLGLVAQIGSKDAEIQILYEKIEKLKQELIDMEDAHRNSKFYFDDLQAKLEQTE